MQIRERWSFHWSFPFAILLAIAGCGKQGPATYPVSGKVTLDGQAVERGQLVFYPEQPQFQPETAEIRGGDYSLQAMPGKKRVEIRASRETGEKGPYGEPRSEEYIPAKYNRETTLEAEVAAQENKLDFELTTK